MTVKPTLVMLNQRGGISLKGLIWLLVFTFALYAGYLFVPPTFSYILMKTEVEDEAKNAHRYLDETLATRIMKKAEMWSLPVNRENIVIKRGFRSISIEVDYTVRISVFGAYDVDRYYYINVVEPLKETSGTLK